MWSETDRLEAGRMPFRGRDDSTKLPEDGHPLCVHPSPGVAQALGGTAVVGNTRGHRGVWGEGGGLGNAEVHGVVIWEDLGQSSNPSSAIVM